MAQSAVSAIRTGCQMLSEGKAEIDKFKKQVEGGISDAKAIYKEVTGIWGWLKSLFVRPTAKLEQKTESRPVLQTAKTTRKTPELSYEEFKANSVHNIFEHLKVYLSAERQLEEHCRRVEEESKTTDNVAESAIDLIEIRWQLHEMKAQVKHAMIYETPQDLGLGAMYENFLITYDEILEAQAVARELKLRQERNARWQQDLLRNHRIDRMVQVLAVLLLLAWTWGFLLSLKWLGTTHDGLWSA
jgi:predicted ATP-dependent protease